MTDWPEAWSGAWPELRAPASVVAPMLLGAVLSWGGVRLRLTEVEAYEDVEDPGSHAARGRTARVATMFDEPGRIYCYLSHGLHRCLNVVAHEPGRAGAVLLRAGEVVDGLDLARSRRPGSSDRDLARGPGRLGAVLGADQVTDGLMLGRDQLGLPDPPLSEQAISRGPRVGLRLAADRPWRYWLTGERTVSPYRRHARAVPDPPAEPPA